MSEINAYRVISLAAIRSAATRRRLRCANERAHETAFDLARDLRDVEPGSRQESGGVLDAINPRRLDVDIGKAGGGKQATVFAFFESARDASNPELHVALHFVRDFSAHDDVGYC